MQLLCRVEIGDYDKWRAGFDAEAENRGAAGLTLLQLWRDTDDERCVLALFEVNDRGRARAYLETAKALGAGLGEATFLRTV